MGKFIQPDTIVPGAGNPQAFDRYSYVLNSPMNYNDPSGHMVTCDLEAGNGCAGTGLGGLTPRQIINAGATPEQEIRAIYNYSVTHPDYNYYNDSELEDTGKAIVANSIFLGYTDYISRKPNIWDRINSSWNGLAYGVSFSMSAILVTGSKGISDNAFVRFDPIKFDSSIDSNGLLTRYSSDGRLWLAQYKDVKNITNPEELETILYRKDLWASKSGYFSDGATLRVVDVTGATPAGVTNKTNGIPQWYITTDVSPNFLQVIRRLFP